MSKDAKVRAVTVAVIVIAFLVVVGREAGWDWGKSAAPSYAPVSAGAEAEPRDTIYRMLDAARDGDVDAYIACYAGQMERALSRTRQEMTDSGFARYLTERNRQIKGIAINEPETVSESQVSVRVEYVYADRNEAQQLHLENGPDGWKIARVDSARRVKTLVPYGTPVY